MNKFWAICTCAAAMTMLMLQCGMQFLIAAVTHFLGVSSLNSGRIRQRCGSLSLGTADSGPTVRRLAWRQSEAERTDPFHR